MDEMTTVGDIANWMNQIAPLGLSEAWDNTGLLMGDRSSPVSKLMTCLTLTDASVDEAVREEAELVVAHHPLPFKPLSRITTDTVPGRLLWKLASAGVAVYSPHTCWDSANGGINAQLAQLLGLRNIEPVVPSSTTELQGLGSGRIGDLPATTLVSDLAQQLSGELSDCRLRGVNMEREVSRVAICCGSGGSLLAEGARRGCDLFLTGEATFHHCLEAEALSLIHI